MGDFFLVIFPWTLLVVVLWRTIAIKRRTDLEYIDVRVERDYLKLNEQRNSETLTKWQQHIVKTDEQLARLSDHAPYLRKFSVLAFTPMSEGGPDLKQEHIREIAEKGINLVIGTYRGKYSVICPTAYTEAVPEITEAPVTTDTDIDMVALPVEELATRNEGTPDVYRARRLMFTSASGNPVIYVGQRHNLPMTLAGLAINVDNVGGPGLRRDPMGQGARVDRDLQGDDLL